MTKEDYMKLPKARLAELLAERDAAQQFTPLFTWQNPCTDPSWPCTNPQHDCVNCPRTQPRYEFKITDRTEWRGIDVKDISKGDFLKIMNENGTYMQGTVEQVSHIVDIWQNAQGLERSTHDIVITINES